MENWILILSIISVISAENVARQWSVTRREQDEFALQSQKKCETAQKSGNFDQEIVPVIIQTRTGINEHFSWSLLVHAAKDKSGFYSHVIRGYFSNNSWSVKGFALQVHKRWSKMNFPELVALLKDSKS